MKITHRYTGATIYEADAPSMLELVQIAVEVGANLCEANLRGADMREANLRGADMRGANLCGANLCGADMREANLCGANLCEANLREANLRGANLCGADMRGADMRGAKIHFAHCPEVGAFSAFKSVYCDGIKHIAELLIPSDAQRTSCLINRKCRASSARVISITTLDGKPATGEFVSWHDASFVYREGDLVECREPFNDDIRIDCASGIHFFITRNEAVEF